MTIPNSEENTSDPEQEQLVANPAETETPQVDEGLNESNLPRDTSESSPHAMTEGDTVESNTNTDTNPPNA